MNQQGTAAPAGKTSNLSPQDLLEAKIFPLVGDRLAYLAGRWADEKEYEDIKDYQENLQKLVGDQFKITSITKRPFGFKATIEGIEFHIFIKLSARHMNVTASWKQKVM